MVTSILDPLNLRDYIFYVVDYIKKWCAPEQHPRTTLSFLMELFDGADFRQYFKDATSKSKTDDDYFETFIKAIQRMFTGNVHYSRFDEFSKDVVSGTYDKLLLKNLEIITEAIENTSRSKCFYSRLLQLVSRRFFSEAEINDIKVFFDEGQFNYLHLVIIKHAFNSLSGIPCFYADRIYEEALTYDFDSPLRFRLMRIAADCGHKNGALEYGNFLAKTPHLRGGRYSLPSDVVEWMKAETSKMNPSSLRNKINCIITDASSEEAGDKSESNSCLTGPDYVRAFDYLLSAVPLPAAIWNACYLVEKHFVGKEQEEALKSALGIQEKIEKSKEFIGVRDELSSVMYTGDEPDEASTMLFCYSVYFYIAYRGFSKGFNSMAKLLYSGTISVYTAEANITTESLCEKYWAYAIKEGNPTALVNYGGKALRELERAQSISTETDKAEYAEELLVVAASLDLMRGNYYLGRFYEFESKSISSPLKTRSGILAIYKHAERLDIDGDGVGGDLYYRIAALSSNEEEKKQEYKKALLAGKVDAAYPLALIYFREYESQKNRASLLCAREYLINYIDFASNETKPSAALLLKTINDEINDLA